jgi:hypothetical protein
MMGHQLPISTPCMIRVFVLFDITATMAAHQEHVISTIITPFLNEISSRSPNILICTPLLCHAFLCLSFIAILGVASHPPSSLSPTSPLYEGLDVEEALEALRKTQVQGGCLESGCLHEAFACMLESLETVRVGVHELESTECLAVLTSKAMPDEARVHESRSPKLIGLQLDDLLQRMLAMDIRCGLVVPWMAFSKGLVECFVKAFPQTPTRANPFVGGQSKMMFLMRNLQGATCANWKGVLHAHSTSSNHQWSVSISADGKVAADLRMSSWPDRLSISSYLDLANPTVKAGLAAGIQLKLQPLIEKDLASWQQFIAKIKAKSVVGLVKWTPSAILLLHAINWDLFGYFITKKQSSTSSDQLTSSNDSCYLVENRIEARSGSSYEKDMDEVSPGKILAKKHQLLGPLKANPNPDSPQMTIDDPKDTSPKDLNQFF